MENTKYPIKIIIAEREYPFSVSAEDEEVMRYAAKVIAGRVDKYKKIYPTKDIQDALAIAAFQCVVQWRKERLEDMSGNLLKEIELMDSQLGDYLEKTR